MNLTRCEQADTCTYDTKCTNYHSCQQYEQAEQQPAPITERQINAFVEAVTAKCLAELPEWEAEYQRQREAEDRAHLDDLRQRVGDQFDTGWITHESIRIGWLEVGVHALASTSIIGLAVWAIWTVTHP